MLRIGKYKINMLDIVVPRQTAATRRGRFFVEPITKTQLLLYHYIDVLDMERDPVSDDIVDDKRYHRCVEIRHCDTRRKGA